MILALGPISGAHLNPLVTTAGLLRREISAFIATAFVLCQIGGGVAGVIVANLMFDLPAVTISSTERTGWNLLLSEVVAAFGLVLVVRLVGRRGGTGRTAFAVGGYVAAAVVFTSSTCFANPAVTVARMFSDTFTGIAPSSVPPFLAAESIGALAAIWCERMLAADLSDGRVGERS